MRKSHAPKAGRLPPLNSVRVFEAAERHRSFTRAAEELCVTQGAVSRAVANFEEYLGFPLFERTGSGLVPLAGVEAFARTVRAKLRDIRDATRILTVQHGEARVLIVQAYSGFASRWLTPRLPDFYATHPGTDIRLVSSHDGRSTATEEADARIRYGRGRWRGVVADLMFRDELCPVCAPSLLPPRPQPYDLSVLATLPLIRLREFPDDWEEWLAVAGLPAHAGKSIVFEELSVAYQAAENGAGVALGQRRHLDRDTKSGRLHEPFDVVLRREQGYYLTFRPTLLEDEDFAAFRGWLLERIAEPNDS